MRHARFPAPSLYDVPNLARCKCVDKRPGFTYSLCPRHNPKSYAAYASRHNTHRKIEA